MVEHFKSEIMETEKAFAQLVREKGLKVGFLAYAAHDAVLSRGGQLIKGHKAIEEYFDQQALQLIYLAWQPDFVSVSASGDLGYTYGKFTLKAIDHAGQEIESEGIFHTVWRKEAAGQWRYVWD